MTLEEMRAQHPDVVAQIEQQAAETARTQERARIEAIDSIAASVGDAQLVRDAKYGETPAPLSSSHSRLCRSRRPSVPST